MTTVYTSGSWDLFHQGHLNVLHRSRALGDRLVVGVSTDELIESYKGCRPIIPFRERMRIVSSIRGVDVVVRQPVLMDVRILKRHRIDIATIGDDWRHKYLAGLEWMKAHGRVVYIPYTKGISSTLIKRRVIDQSFDMMVTQLRNEPTAGNAPEGRSDPPARRGLP